jgi:hypothetical protein
MDNSRAKVEIAKVKLKKLFTDHYFNICEFDALLAMMQVHPPKEEYDMIRSLHCVYFSEMNREVREWLFNACLSVIQCDRFNLSAIDMIGSGSKQSALLESGFAKYMLEQSVREAATV